MRSISELKKEAISSLGGSVFSQKWLYGVGAVVIVGAISFLLGFDYKLDYLDRVLEVIAFLISGFISFGLISFFMSGPRKKDYNIASLLDGFKNGNAGSAFVTGLLQNIFTFLWTLLLIVPGLIKMYSYSLTFVLITEDNSLSSNEAITKSRELMDGKKMDLFLLDLSFIGWYIVGILCVGVGVFWAAAYHQTARAYFFQDVLDENGIGVDKENAIDQDFANYQ